MSHDPHDLQIPATAQLLLEAAHRAPSADNTQPWQFVWDGKAVHVGFDALRTENHVFTAESRASQLTMGAIYENALQVARDSGFGLGNFTPRSDITTAIDLELKGRPPSHREREAWIEAKRRHPVFERHTNREAYSKEPLPRELLEELAAIEQDTACVRVFAETREIKRVASLIRKASEARFRTRELHEWLYGSLRFEEDGSDADDGLALETLGLPPGGAFLLKSLAKWSTMSRLNRLRFYKILANIETATFQKAPAIVAVLAPKTPENAYQPQLFASGRVMERAWIAINRAGFAAHPSYVITDQIDRLEAGKVPAELRGGVAALHREANGLFAEGAQALCVLFRVGRPRKEAIRSRRRPLDEMVHLRDLGSVR